MKPERIRDLLSLGEGQRIEFKSSANNVDALGSVICGFLNTAGGYLICGIREPGQIVGLDVSEEAIARLERNIHEGLSPKALVSFQSEVLEGQRVLIIEVPAGKDVPYAFRDTIYLREDDVNRRANASAIRDIVMRRQIEPERWERRFSFADIDTDVDLAEVRGAIADAVRVKRAFFRDASKPLVVLEDFAAAKYGRLTQAGDVLFTNNPAQRLPQTRIRAMRYNSDKAGDRFGDLKSFEGPLHRVFEEAYSFIVRNTPSPARFIPGNPKRQDAPLYPEEAVREALINALAHRDYSAASGGVSIHVFPHRLEIWNSGPLPEGVTPEALLKGQISVLRNPDIAHALYLRGLMEKAGRGSVLMVKQCQDVGLPVPVWKSDSLGVTLTFQAPDETPHVAQHVTPHVAQHVTPHVRRLLAALTGEMSRAELMSALKIKDRVHFSGTYLRPALKIGLVEMTQPDKPRSVLQRYRLTALAKSVLNEATP